MKARSKEAENWRIIAISSVMIMLLVVVVTAGMLNTSRDKEDDIVYKQIQTNEGNSVFAIYEDGNFVGIDKDGDLEVDEKEPSYSLWGSTRISDNHIGTKLLALNDTGQITFGENQNISITYDVETDTIAYWGGGWDFTNSNISNSGNISARNFIVTEDVVGGMDDTKHIDVTRMLFSTKSQEIYVGENGSDSNSGSASSPLKTLREAYKRMPIFIHHRFWIWLYPGNYSGEPRGSATHFVGADGHDGPFMVKSTTGIPSDVNITGTLRPYVIQNEQDNPTYKGLTFGNMLLQGVGNIRVEDCNFTGTSYGFNSHSPTFTEFINCTFHSSLDYAVYISRGAEVYMKMSSGYVNEYAIKLDGAIYREGDNNPTLYGKKGKILKSAGSVATDRYGRRYINSAWFSDDFGDFNISDRFGQRIANERPPWTIFTGNPYISNDKYLVCNGSVELYKATYMTTGAWIWRFRYDGNLTSGESVFDVMKSGTDYIRVEVKTYAIRLVGNIGGYTLMINTGRAYDYANWTDIKIRRSDDIDGLGNAGYRMWINDKLIGEYLTDYIPINENNVPLIRVDSDSLQELYFDDLYLKQE